MFAFRSAIEVSRSRFVGWAYGCNNLIAVKSVYMRDVRTCVGNWLGCSSETGYLVRRLLAQTVTLGPSLEDQGRHLSIPMYRLTRNGWFVHTFQQSAILPADGHPLCHRQISCNDPTATTDLHPSSTINPPTSTIAGRLRLYPSRIWRVLGLLFVPLIHPFTQASAPHVGNV